MPPTSRRLVGLAVALVLLAVPAIVVAPANAALAHYTGTIVQTAAMGGGVNTAQVYVTLHDDGGVDRSVMADPTGEFAFDLDLRPVNYGIAVRSYPFNSLDHHYVETDFTVDAAVTNWGTFEVTRYGNITGTIPGWVASMNPTLITAVKDDGGTWGDHGIALYTADGTFAIPGIDEDDDYTLFFDVPDSAPYLDSYLGGELFDPTLADTVSGTAEQDAAVTATPMVAAQVITGTVLHAGLPVDGADIIAVEENGLSGFHTVSLFDGSYSLSVLPGFTYAVFAAASPYELQAWDHVGACGCGLTPVVAASLPAAGPSGIDFDLVVPASEVELDIHVTDPGGGSATLTAHLFVQVAGAWIEVDSYDTDPGGNVDLYGTTDGMYRIGFESGGDWFPIGHYSMDGGPQGSAAGGGCYIETGSLLTGTVHVIDANVDPAVTSPACADPSLLAGGGSPTGGSGSGSTSGSPRASGSGRGVSAPPIPTPTATATPRPTSTPSARPTAIPEPTASPAPEAAAETTPGAWVLWWVLIVLGVLGIAATVVMLVRARRR